MDGGDHWQKLDFPDPGMVVWSFLFHPQNPQILYLGTALQRFIAATTAGRAGNASPSLRAPGRSTWDSLRVIRLAADPSNPEEIYAGLEVGGGSTVWTAARPGRLLSGPAAPGQTSAPQKPYRQRYRYRRHDGHACPGASVQPGPARCSWRLAWGCSGARTAAKPGPTWKLVASPLTYARDVQVSPHDPKVLYACLSSTESGWLALPQPGSGPELETLRP